MKINNGFKDRVSRLQIVNVRGWKYFSKIGGKPAPFCSFSSFCQYNDKYSTKFDYKWKKRKWCAWNSNPGTKDCRRR